MIIISNNNPDYPALAPLIWVGNTLSDIIEKLKIDYHFYNDIDKLISDINICWENVGPSPLCFSDYAGLNWFMSESR